MYVLINAPKEIAEAEEESDDFYKRFDHDQLKLGFQFFADMLNRMAFVVITLVLVISFAVIYITTWTLFATGI